VRDVLALTPERPLYGHKSGKLSKTHWIAFLKPNKEINPKDISCETAQKDRKETR